MGMHQLNKMDKDTGEVTGTLNVAVTVTPIPEPKGNLRAFVGIDIEGMFATNDLRLLEGQNGLFLNMPQKRVGNEFKDTFFPVQKGLRETLTNIVKGEYATALGELENKQESVLAAIKERKEAANGTATKDKAAGKDADKGNKNNKHQPEH